MSFDILEIAVIAAVALVALVALTAVRLRKPSKEKEYKTYNAFLGMGIIWLVVALIYNLSKGNYILDTEASLFHLGLIFTIVGGVGVLVEHLRR